MMDANARTAQILFVGNDRYVVPAYQRPFVWEEERQWQPLWEDIERLADARLEGREELHFLGAIVLRQEKSAPGGLSEWSVIDGQQRLTSLQLLFSAMADAARGDNVPVEAQRLSRLTLHEELEAQGDERFRFWPTTVNRDSYRAVMQDGGPDPDREDDPNNTIEEAWLFFRDCARDYAAREDEDAGVDPANPEAHLITRYAALREAAGAMIQVVAIQLEESDPAQVIFETLNARGTPLLATDLVKNALLDRASQAGSSMEEVHDKYWAEELGDYEYWSQDERLGRITVPRSEAFLMHWLAMKLGEVIPADTLFDRFRREFLDGPDAADPVELLKELTADAKLVRSFDDMSVTTPAGSFLASARMLDTTTFQPLVLALLRLGLSDDQQSRAFGELESYMIRRMIVGLTAKNYNKLAGELVKAIDADPENADEALIKELLGSQAETSRWPSDDELREHLRVQPLYGWMGRQKIITLLGSIELARQAQPKTEGLEGLPKKLQIEHVMPQAWNDNWTDIDLNDDEAVAQREGRINMLGNLTLITPPLNGSISNKKWEVKKDELEENSQMMLNKDFRKVALWDEAAIDARGAKLTEEIIVRWPGPQHYIPEGWKVPDAELEPQNAEMSPEEMTEIYSAATPFIRELLTDLAAHPNERRTYAQVEESISWPHRRLPAVLSDYVQRFGQFDGRRPFRINLDGDGTWWMWVDEDAAAVISELAAEQLAKAGEPREKALNRIELDEVRELIDLIPQRFEAIPGCSADLFRASGDQVKLHGLDGRSASGYFASGWLFLWWSGRFIGDQEWFASRLSKSDQVRLWGRGDDNIRLHVASAADLDVVIEALSNSTVTASA